MKLTGILSLPFVFVSICFLGDSSVAAQAPGSGRVTCKVLENGEAASGTVSLRKGGAEVVQGGCSQPLTAPAGIYTAVISLDGALDAPEQNQPVTIQAGAVAEIFADFSTGILQVFIDSDGKQAAGMAVIRRDGRQVGTLGSGVAAHLSAGKYEVVARYRTEKKSFDNVTIERGKRLVLNASFK
jgi:hypothetical protein